MIEQIVTVAGLLFLSGSAFVIALYLIDWIMERAVVICWRMLGWIGLVGDIREYIAWARERDARKFARSDD